MTVFGKKLCVTDDIDGNAHSISNALDEAAAAKADVLLTPEGSLSGYTHLFDQELVERRLKEIVARAAHLGVALALGTCYHEAPDSCHNQIRFYTRGGEYLGSHSKILRCGSLDTPPVGEINNYRTTPLRTFILDGHCVGGLICNDLWANPQCTPMDDTHLCRRLSTMGARVVFHAVNGGRDGSDWSEVAYRFHESNLRMRAKAAGVWLVTADSSNPVDLPSSAPSGVISPEGEWVTRADDRGEVSFKAAIL